MQAIWGHQRGSLLPSWKVTLLIVVTAVPQHSQAGSLSGRWGDIDWSLGGSLAAGVAVRLQNPKDDLIGKSNLDPALCREDACQSQSGETEPNQRFVDAPGLFTVATDDANMNYRSGDLVSAPLRGTLDAQASWGDWTFLLSGLAFRDVVNQGFVETNLNTDLQPARERRSKRVEDEVGQRVDLRDAVLYGSLDLPFVPQRVFVSVGQQTLRWGEATVLVLNSLAEWTPPDVTLLAQPGIELKNALQPVPLATIATPISDSMDIELVYQFGWRPVRVPPVGSFLAFNDVVEGEYASVGFGNFPEDPNGEYRQPGLGSLISTSSRTSLIERPREPRDGGQFGAKLTWLSEFNAGTEFGFYFARTHSRLPALSFQAADRSCARDATVPGVAGLVVACGGGSGPLNPLASASLLGPLGDQLNALVSEGLFADAIALLQPLTGTGDRLIGGELTPIDTLRTFLEYPEDVDLYGLSFNTTILGWSVVGEIAHRANQPLQITPRDLVFAGLTPALPEESVMIGPFTLPAADIAIPNFVSDFRGIAVEGGDYVRGYERFPVTQFMLGALYQFGPRNPFFADSLTVLPEIGATWVQDLPPIDQLQITAGGPAETHFSPGADGTGSASGEPDSRRINPTQSANLFAEEWSWGARLALLMDYPQVLPFDWGLKVALVGFWDIEGRGPLPIENFVEGRKQLVSNIEVQLRENLVSIIQGTFFTGGGGASARRDRDFAAFSVRYTF